MEALIGHLPRTHTQLYSDSQVLANNLSKFQIDGSVNNKNIIIRKNDNVSDFTQLYATEDMLEFGAQVNGVWKSIWKAALKSDLNTVLMYRGVVTGDLNRGRNLVLAPGIYSIQGASTIINGPSDFGGWGIFVQFPDNLFSQIILNSPNYIKFRKYSGSDPSWSAW